LAEERVKIRYWALAGGVVVLAVAGAAYLAVSALERRVDEALEQARVSVDKLAELRVQSRGFVGFGPDYRLQGVTITVPRGVKIVVDQFLLAGPTLHTGFTVGYQTVRVSGATITADGVEIGVALAEVSGLKPVAASVAKDPLDRFTAQAARIGGFAATGPGAVSRFTIDLVEAREVSSRRIGEVGWSNFRVTGTGRNGPGALTIAAMRLTGFELLGEFKPDSFRDLKLRRPT
jgi:hypothetical protein